MKNLESKLFLLIAFFIGTWGALFHAMQTGLIALGLIYNIVKYKDDFVRNIKKYKYYVAIPVIYILYSAVHTLIIVTSGKYAGLKPGFGIFEKEFLSSFSGWKAEYPIQTENEALQKRFQIYADDEHKAYYILTPQVWKKLWNLLMQWKVRFLLCFIMKNCLRQ